MNSKQYIMNQTTIAAIDDELHYMSTLNAQGRSDGEHHGLEGQLLTLKVYVDKAIAAWVNNPNDAAALEELRKVAAIAVRGMLTEGTRFRSWSRPKAECNVSHHRAH